MPFTGRTGSVERRRKVPDLCAVFRRALRARAGRNDGRPSNDDPQSEDPYLTEIEKDAEMTKKFGANGVFNG